MRGASEEPLTTGLHRDLFADCWPLYQHLKRHALRPQRPPGAVPRPLPPAGAASDPVSHPSSADQAAGSGAAAACYNAAASSSATSASGAGAVAVAPPLSGTHATVPDARNAHILVGIRNGVSLDFELVPRAQAAVSVLDSGFVLGDGVWEGASCFVTFSFVVSFSDGGMTVIPPPKASPVQGRCSLTWSASSTSHPPNNLSHY